MHKCSRSQQARHCAGVAGYKVRVWRTTVEPLQFPRIYDCPGREFKTDGVPDVAVPLELCHLHFLSFDRKNFPYLRNESQILLLPLFSKL